MYTGGAASCPLLASVPALQPELKMYVRVCHIKSDWRARYTRQQGTSALPLHDVRLRGGFSLSFSSLCVGSTVVAIINTLIVRRAEPSTYVGESTMSRIETAMTDTLQNTAATVTKDSNDSAPISPLTSHANAFSLRPLGLSSMHKDSQSSARQSSTTTYVVSRTTEDCPLIRARKSSVSGRSQRSGGAALAPTQVLPLRSSCTTTSGCEEDLDTSHRNSPVIETARVSCQDRAHEGDDAAGSHQSSAILPGDPFRDKVQIPSCKPAIFAYPHSRPIIDLSFSDRFREVVNIFRHNMKQHPRLKNSLEYVDYTLTLCGTSSTDSHPSILVFCRHREFKDLRDLLMSKDLKYQYGLRRPSRRHWWSGSEATAVEEGLRPLFNLFFWRTLRPRTLYWGQRSVRIYPPVNTAVTPLESLGSLGPSETTPHIVPELSMCGAVVEVFSNRRFFSTLGCVIKLGSKSYGITSRHGPMEGLQHSQSADNCDFGTNAVAAVHVKSHEEEHLDRCETDSASTIPEDEDYYIDTVEYDSMDEGNEEESVFDDSSLKGSLDGHENAAEARVDGGEYHNTIALFVPSCELEESSEQDYDWALIELKDQEEQRPNAVVDPTSGRNVKLIGQVAEIQPRKETPVLIVTGGISPQRGLLQPGSSFLGGCSGSVSSTVWTVILNKQASKSK